MGAQLLYRADTDENGKVMIWRPPAMKDPASRIVRHASNADVVREAYMASHGIKPIGGGGGLTTQYTELFPELPIADGTAVASFTTESSTTFLNPAPQPYFPPHYWLAGRAVRVYARGVLGSTGSPTYQFTVRQGTAYPATQTSTLLGQSGAITAATTITNGVWELEVDMICRASGVSGSIQTGGLVAGPAFANTTNSSIPSLSATWTATVDTTLAQGLWLGIICSASSASNTITLKQLLVLGLN